MATATKKEKKEEAYPWKASASSGHITNIKQSIWETFDIYGSNVLPRFFSVYLAGGRNKYEGDVFTHNSKSQTTVPMCGDNWDLTEVSGLRAI